MSDKPALLSEDLDRVAFSERDHGLLPGAGRANVIAHALGLRLTLSVFTLTTVTLKISSIA